MCILAGKETTTKIGRCFVTRLFNDNFEESELLTEKAGCLVVCTKEVTPREAHLFVTVTNGLIKNVL